MKLTTREKEVLRRLSEGLTYKEIGHELKISMNTVRTHLKQIYRKLGVRSGTAAVVKWMRAESRPKRRG
jgi:DNA-binding NarL/FixJ family response regulator